MPTTEFTDRVSSDGSTDFPAVAGRYHLYVSYACPWAHRTIIGRGQKGLEDAIGISVLDPIRDDRGWAFTGGEYVDHANGFEFLSEAYAATDPDYDFGYTVPVLWDTLGRRIVCNQSGDILRMLSEGFAALAPAGRPNLYPLPLGAEIDALNEHVYQTVNKAVYRAGFTRDQEVYEREVETVFASLDALDARLADRRFLFGAEPVETDWRLFTTLLRFDPVYHIHFKLSLRRVRDYPSLWPYLRDLYQWPGVAETVRLDEVRAHYYRTHPWINPSALVAVAPAGTDLAAPHGRARLGEPAPRAA